MSSENNETGMIVALTLIFLVPLMILFGVALFFLESKALLEIWHWFIAPTFQLRELSLVQMAALNLFLSLMLTESTAALLIDIAKKDDQYKYIAFKHLLNKVAFLGWAFCLALIMHLFFSGQ